MPPAKIDFGIIKGLPPTMLGPGAYFAGLRFRRLARPDAEVTEAFQIALTNAPRNSSLERLTRIELEKMGKKK